MVVAVQEEAHQRWIQGDLPGADPVHDALYRVGKPHDGIQPEEPRRPLDGVHGSEHGIDRLAWVHFSLDAEKRRLHGPQQFPGFDDEGLFRLVEIHGDSLRMQMGT